MCAKGQKRTFVSAKTASLFDDRLESRFVQRGFAWSSWVALQATHMRMGSIGLLCATQTRVPHCSHSQLNDGVDGNGTSSTRGQASTSRNSKSGMDERYTRNLFGSCHKSRKVKIRSRLPTYHNREVSSRNWLESLCPLAVIWADIARCKRHVRFTPESGHGRRN